LKGKKFKGVETMKLKVMPQNFRDPQNRAWEALPAMEGLLE
jgi:hypothetical protein